MRLKEAQEKEARARAAAAQEELERELLQLRWEVKKLKLDHELWCLEQKYSPSQPRVPAGSPDGGRWARDSGKDGGDDRQILSDVTPDNDWKPGAQYAQDTTRRYSVDLDEEEAPRGIGHTQRDHVSKTDAELIDVLEKDWTRVERLGLEVTKYRPAQGSFLSRESANDLVNRTLEDNKEAVDLVASGQANSAILEKRFGYVTGKEAFRPNGDAEPYIRDTYGVRMVIRHDLHSDRSYRVYTAFPVNELMTRK